MRRMRVRKNIGRRLSIKSNERLKGNSVRQNSLVGNKDAAASSVKLHTIHMVRTPYRMPQRTTTTSKNGFKKAKVRGS